MLLHMILLTCVILRNIISDTMIIPIIPPKKYIDELREIAGLSDAEIAEAAGLTRTTIWRLRHGKHKTTSAEPGIRIANLHSMVFKKKASAERRAGNGH